MKLIIQIINNEIFAHSGDNGIEIIVRDTDKLINRQKFARFMFDGNRVRTVSSEYDINRTSDMRQDVENNLKFILTEVYECQQ